VYMPLRVLVGSLPGVYASLCVCNGVMLHGVYASLCVLGENSAQRGLFSLGRRRAFNSVSLLDSILPTVNTRFTVGVTPGPGLRSLSLLNIPDIQERTKGCRKLFPVCQERRVYGRQNEPRINHEPYRKQCRKAQKPATESTCAQGRQESEELYSTDQNCNSTGLSLSAQTPGYSPMESTFLTGISQNNPGITGIKVLKTPLNPL